MAKSKHFDDDAHRGESSSTAGGLSEDRPLKEDAGAGSQKEQNKQSDKFMDDVKDGKP